MNGVKMDWNLIINTVIIVQKINLNQKEFSAFPLDFLAACENGHIDDFPWNRFVRHTKNCKGSDLKLIDRGSSIDKVFVRCESCKVKESTGCI